MELLSACLDTQIITRYTNEVSMERGHPYEHNGTTEIVEMQKPAELKGSNVHGKIIWIILHPLVQIRTF